jgi:KDO2-lipid IV(A) lauroyltransferase
MKGLVAETSAQLHFILSPKKRENVRANLSAIGGPPSQRHVRSIYRNHAENIIEIFASDRWNEAEIEKRIIVEGGEALDRALDGRRGVILVTAHLGNWEIAALRLSSLGCDLHVVTGVQMNRLLFPAVRDAKERRGIGVINPEHSYREIFRVLSSNGVVALLLDGDVFTGGREVEFFGKPTVLPAGAIRLSRKTGASIVGGYCRRLEGGRYRIRLEPILTSREASMMTDSEALAALYGRIEQYIRSNSDQWCIFRRLWKE